MPLCNSIVDGDHLPAKKSKLIIGSWITGEEIALSTDSDIFNYNAVAVGVVCCIAVTKELRFEVCLT